MVDEIRVMLVDDESGFTSTLSKRLNRKGLDVHTADSGMDALSALHDEHYDVVVLDMKMPGMDGMQTLKAIKKEHPKIEVILLTGHADIRDAVDSMDEGAFDFLTKPANADLLYCRIRDAAKSAALRGQGRSGDADGPDGADGAPAVAV